MMRTGLALVAVGLALVSSRTDAALHNFAATLDGAQETPPNVSAGTGSGSFVLDTATGIVSYNITFSGLDSAETAFHVHVGPLNVAGPILYALPLGSPKVGSSPALNATQQSDMLAGLHYVNVHSVMFPAGEIRGQILLTNQVTQFLPTKLFLVKNPGPADKRKVVYKVKELPGNPLTAEGDPTVDGAKRRRSASTCRRATGRPSRRSASSTRTRSSRTARSRWPS